MIGVGSIVTLNRMRMDSKGKVERVWYDLDGTPREYIVRWEYQLDSQQPFLYRPDDLIEIRPQREQLS